jgi:hypothetical protein
VTDEIFDDVLGANAAYAREFRLAGTKARIRVDRMTMGTATVNSVGTARINRSGGGIPAVSKGSTIRVRRLTGVLVASGTFG